MKNSTKTTLVAVALGFLSAATSVHAIGTLRISADLGATWVTVRDIDGDGNVSFSGSVGTVGNMWSVSVAAGETRPAIGSAQDPILNLSTLGVSSVAAGTLLIEFSDKSFTAPLTGDYFTTSLSSQNALGGSTTVQTYWDLDNTMFARTTRLGRITQTGLDDQSSIASTSALPEAGLYSLTTRVSIFHAADGSSSFDSGLVDPPGLPEGGSTVALLGLALLGLGAFGVWRNRVRVA